MRKSVALVVIIALAAGCMGRSHPPAASSSEPPETSTVSTTAKEGSLTVRFTFDPAAPVVGQLIHFVDASDAGDASIESLSWDFGDGHAGTGRSFFHSFAQSGNFAVSHTVSDTAGHQAEAKRTIHIANGAPTPTQNGTAPPPSGGLVFRKPVKIQDANGGEPSLAIDADGRVFVNPIGSLYRATNATSSFARASYISLFAGDSHVVADRDQRIWVSDLVVGALVAPTHSVVWTSTDHGNSFQQGNPIANDGVIVDRNWLAASAGGKGYLLYRQCTPAGAGSCFTFPGSLMTRSLNGGLDWTPVTSTFAWTAFPFVDPNDGTLYVVEAGGTGNIVNVAVSTDDGGSFSTNTVSERRTAATNLFLIGDVDAAGNVYVAWADTDHGDQTDVYYAVSKDKGAHWGKPVTLSGPGSEVFPWIAAGAAGHVAVAWYGTNSTAKPFEAPATTEWYPYVAYSEDAADKEPTFTIDRVTEAPIHKGSICLAGSGCGNADRDLLDFFSARFTPQGKVAIAYADDTGGSANGARTMFTVQR